MQHLRGSVRFRGCRVKAWGGMGWDPVAQGDRCDRGQGLGFMHLVWDLRLCKAQP